MTVEELQKQLAASQAQVQQYRDQLAKVGAGAAQPNENPFSVASRMAEGAKTAADAADAKLGSPVPFPQPGGKPVPMPGADSVPDPSKPTLTPEEDEYRRNRAMLADLYVRQALMEANRPYRRPITSSKMPEDPYDKMMARQLSSPAMDSYFRMSGADQAKIDRRAGMAGMDVAGFLGLSPLDQYKAINGMGSAITPMPGAGERTGGTVRTLPALPGRGGGVAVPLSENAVITGRSPDGTVYTRNGASPASRIPTTQFNSFDSGVRTAISANAPAFGAPYSGADPFIRGASAPINASRKSSEIARDLTYRSNLAGAALDSLRRPAMRFGF